MTVLDIGLCRCREHILADRTVARTYEDFQQTLNQRSLADTALLCHCSCSLDKLAHTLFVYADIYVGTQYYVFWFEVD